MFGEDRFKNREVELLNIFAFLVDRKQAKKD